MILVLTNLLLLFVVLVTSNGEDRRIYLILLEGDPVAFHQVKIFSSEVVKLTSKRYSQNL